MSADTLLVEIRTEELPPKALARLGKAFADALRADLAKDGFLEADSALEWFATPRRLAVAITRVRDTAPDAPIERQGPLAKSALDADGKPTQALLGFARKSGVAIDALEQRETPRGMAFFYRAMAKGAALDTSLAAKVEAALKALPIPKVMRWGAGEAEFVRPAHGLVMLHGGRIVPGAVLGLASGRTTLGHRSLSAGPLTLADAGDYARMLRVEGHVIASFETRRRAIAEGLERAAGREAAYAPDEALLDEVTALTEAPAVYAGEYSPEFLEVPSECLVLSMKQHQKYFPLLEPGAQRLMPRFLIVSNLPSADPAAIVHGNERVLRARLADAKFFYDQDRKVRLEDRVPQLAQVVYHNRLGTQLDRAARLERLAARYAQALGIDPAPAARAAKLVKADLLTGMVGEFPELQGVMGRYYALHDGEPAAVADAIRDHYRPRYSGDALPESTLACAIALADKLEMLAGLFGIGQQSTGDRDPYGLRRQALGVVRILAERRLPLALSELIEAAFGAFDASCKLAPAHADLEAFFYDRMHGYFAEAGFSVGEVDAVLALVPQRIDLVPLQLEAVKTFNTLPEAPSLAAANKRIGNILKRAGDVPPTFDAALLTEAPEKALAAQFEATRRIANEHYDRQEYTRMLEALASLKAPVDAFFDSVMVMTDDAQLRANRVALLGELQQTMNRIADISRLAV